eukprot:CAMPEP_0202881366 /NCGR_PEP_ID=MMETSP1391-20130828/36419_1 /ASSEMBLY_ACC=CAM_ASM_000867 /TAXON_ID=1034604 /ORGANISM="Chlamydomonas leiostraca, Strain SAG 11-49" /LENGTH=424 /DNA_ID=CAMNT_0049564039 /DNA_START=6 /DNA_END=1280 /DNA_ORIENTATION=-
MTKKEIAKAAAEARRQALAAVKKQEREERLEHQPWTPQVAESVVQSWVADVEQRAGVGVAAPPSCCFFTFANSRHMMNCAAFTRDVTYMAAGFADSSVRVYNVAQLSQPAPASTSGGKGAGTSKQGAAGGSKGASAMEVDGRGGDPFEEDQQPGVSYLHGHTAPVHAVDFSHDARLLLSGAADGTVRLWSPELQAGLAAFRGHLLPVWDVASGPLGYHFATASADRTARLWSTDKMQTIRIFAGHQADVDVVRWHPNTHYIATASSDRTVRLWDVCTGACVRFLVGLQAAPTSMSVSPDGRQVAVGGEDGAILIWDLGTARRLATLTGHVGPVWSLAHSWGDGACLASGGADETVRLWSLEQIAASQKAAGAAAGGGGDDGAKPAKPLSLQPMSVYRTKSTPVSHVQFSFRNLLLGAGCFSLRQ